MKIIDMPRASGKTTKAIESAYLTNSALLVANSVAAKNIQEYADKHLEKVFGAKKGALKVIAVGNLACGSAFGTRPPYESIVIDELDYVISTMLQAFGVHQKVVLATRTQGDH